MTNKGVFLNIFLYMTRTDVLFHLKPLKQQTILKLGPTVTSPSEVFSFTQLISQSLVFFDENIIVFCCVLLVGFLIWHTVVVGETF